MHEKPVRSRPVGQQGNQQGDVAADDQHRRNTERGHQVQHHSAEAAVVLPATSHAFQDRLPPPGELGSVPCDTEDLGVRPIDAGRTPNRHRNFDTSCDRSVIKRESTPLCVEPELWDWRH